MKKYSLTRKKLFNTYGLTYTKTDLFLTVLLFCISIGTICYLQKLNVYFSAIVIITTLCTIPFLVSSFFKYKYEKKYFEEYCLYFESVKMFFKTYRKLIKALQETYKFFDEKSKMGICIKKAIDEIEETGNYEKALSYIDEKFHNSYLERLHSLLITGEKQGSDSVYYNLDEIKYQAWKDDIKFYQAKKKAAKLMFYLMSVIALVISLYSSLMFTSDQDLMNALISTFKYQLYTFVNIELMLLLFIYIYVSLVSKKWVRSDE